MSIYVFRAAKIRFTYKNLNGSLIEYIETFLCCIFKRKDACKRFYKTTSLTQTINSLVGKPLTIRQRNLIGGALSPKLLITKCSSNLHNLLILDANSIKTCWIELRPKGIIAHFVNLLNKYMFIAPYYNLDIKKQTAGEYTLALKHNYINVLVSGKSQDFMEKLIQQKLIQPTKKPEDF
ncbi:hypothetical protein NBRC110019_24050 [Neptunitalea chrysea]|uniref:Uncharacterized protein n=1 Tax=Neptunitalea chrysea TaxID=1647581 RepID=A0A9W6B647_9FLAO|nr:hypothetical protein [Neptunitalea chrysea]GLB53364.1 hypothetical protein NBRC110019_24050 [Neptunitalea chrysea]